MIPIFLHIFKQFYHTPYSRVSLSTLYFRNILFFNSNSLASGHEFRTYKTANHSIVHVPLFFNINNNNNKDNNSISTQILLYIYVIFSSHTTLTSASTKEFTCVNNTCCGIDKVNAIDEVKVHSDVLT